MFEDEYRRANDNIHAREELLMELQKKHYNGTSYKWIYKVAAGVAACLVLCGGILGIRAATKGGSQVREASGVIAVADAAIVNGVESYDQLYKLMNQSRNSNYLMGTDDIVYSFDSVKNEATAEMPAAEPAPNAAPQVSEDAAADVDMVTEGTSSGSNGSNKDYSTTNTQVKDVDEADIVKTDGDYIYTLSWNTNKLYIVKVDGSDMTVSGEIRFREESENEWWYAQEFYVIADRLLLISSHETYNTQELEKEIYQKYTANTCVTVYDISDRSNVSEISRLEQSGNYSDSRMVNGYLYLISNYYSYDWIKDQPITYCPSIVVDGDIEVMPVEDILIYEEPSDSSYTVITAIEAETGTQFSSQTALFGAAGTVYCNTEHIVLAANEYKSDVQQGLVTEDGRYYDVQSDGNSTKLVLFDYSDGQISQTASTQIEGTLLNQFSIDEFNGYFRVVVTRETWQEIVYTDGRDVYEWNNTSDNALYVLDGSLNIVGRVENLAQDERVYSVRFDGDIGYFVTFRQTDPLFTVDLSDPFNPTVLSTLKIPGFSSYLHPFGDGLLLGIGYDADEETGRTNCIKLSMFDVSDKTNVTEASTVLLTDVYWSEATNNHKAILVDVEKNLIAFPAEDTYYVYAFDTASGFTLKGEVQYNEDDEYFSYANMRGLYIGNCFFVVSQERIIALDLGTYQKLGTLELN
ncbi:MAG: beta-propeller domain-containing protein [Eubacteriales bacterium]|nr:beta-propeller domain-containing protein [Eubacteriales bacterium]